MDRPAGVDDGGTEVGHGHAVLCEPLPAGAHADEHVLDHVLGGRPVADKQRREPDQFDVPGMEQVGDPGLVAWLGLRLVRWDRRRVEDVSVCAFA